METERLLDSVAGTSVSPSYFIENDVSENEVQLFVTMTSGNVTIEASANNVDFAPINIQNATGLVPLTLTTSAVVPIDLAEGSYLRLSYDTAVGLTAFAKPKKAKQ